MRSVLALAVTGILALASSASAATITLTTAMGNGADTTIRRGNSTDYSRDTSVAMKMQGTGENNSNDRIGLLKFDTSSLPSAGPISNVTLQLKTNGTTSTGNSGNSFLGGHVVHLYGVPDGHAQENFNPSTITFANFAFTTGSSGNHARPAVDVAINGIDDTMAILLGSFIFPETPRYQPVGMMMTFSTVPLTQFLSTDSNGVVSFILVSMTDGPGQVPTVYSAESLGTAGAVIPTLLIETAAGPAVPEPMQFGAVALGLAALTRRRKLHV